MEKWEDYYKLLQVHHDAENEVIEAAYKRLCKKYHPDVNSGSVAAEKMKKINVAYENLKDNLARKKYHIEWIQKSNLKSSSSKGSFSEQIKKNAWENGTDFLSSEDARIVMHSYLNLLSDHNYYEAYGLLTEWNKTKIAFESFNEWQNSVSALYSIGEFKTKVFKEYTSKWVGLKKYDFAVEFEIDLSEKDLSTGVVSSSHFTKLVVKENGEWKVFLEYTDLNLLIYKFKFLNYSKGKPTAFQEFTENAIRTDVDTGMINKRGFFEHLERENNRFLRYHTTFSVVIFNVSCATLNLSEKSKKLFLEHIAYAINNNVRNTDIVAYIGELIFAVIYIESDHHQAMFAAEQIKETLKSILHVQFDVLPEIQIGIEEHSGRNPIKTFNIACEMAGVSQASEWGGGFEVTGVLV